MTRFAPLWQQAASYPAQLDRGLLAALWPLGGWSGPPATTVAGTMQVSLPPGSVAVPLVGGQGTALGRWDAPELVALAAAPPSGQSRLDLVIAQVRDNAIDGGPDNDFIFDKVTGVPAASNPALPAVPLNALAMLSVLVPGAVANLNTATLTDLRPGNLATAPAAPAAQVLRQAPWSVAIASVPTLVPYDTVVVDALGNYDKVTNLFTCPEEGLYLVEGGILLTLPIGINNQYILSAMLNGAEKRRMVSFMNASTNQIVSLQAGTPIYAKAGDTLSLGYLASGAPFQGNSVWGNFVLLNK